MVPFLPLLPCESSVSVKKTLIEKNEGNAKVEKAVSDLTATELNNDERINTVCEIRYSIQG